jgi:DnaJ domain
MADFYKGAHRDGDREFNSLVAAGLVCGFRQNSPPEVYEKALKCFDVLLDILEDPGTAEKISAMINSPAEAVMQSVQTIIDLLLFNAANDPYMSLCLPRYASEEQINRRWKRLIVSYHPDKYPGRREYEERAKRINETYETIQKTGKGFHVDEALRNIIRRNADYVSLNDEIAERLSGKETSRAYKYLRHLPAVILFSSLLVAIISILLFIYVG